MTFLSVNLNKVALVRNTRHLGIPSVTRAAVQCLQAGAQGITVHPRPDARHIRADDVRDLALLLREWPQREFNIEGNPFHNLMDFVREWRPHQATFVPDGEGQFTSDHGWSLAQDGERLRPLIDECHRLGVRVSLFMDAQPDQMALARQCGADRGGRWSIIGGAGRHPGDVGWLGQRGSQWGPAALRVALDFKAPGQPGRAGFRQHRTPGVRARLGRRLCGRAGGQ